MNFSALQAFVKVVELGSFTRAADALDTQKAHLSRVISRLEAELGVQLLVRSTRALSVTEVGQEFFGRAVGILAAAADAQRIAQLALGEPHGTLRLTCGVEFGMVAVSQWINRYMALYPQVRVQADFTDHIVDIVREGTDLAIRVGQLADSGLAARKLGEIEHGLFASPEYLAQHGVPLTPDELSAHDILAFSGGSHPGVWTLKKANRTVRIAHPPRMSINNVFAVRDAVAAGLGIAWLPRMIAGPLIKTGQAQRVLRDWAIPARPVHAVFASTRHLTPKVRVFIDLAIREMAD